MKKKHFMGTNIELMCEECPETLHCIKHNATGKLSISSLSNTL